MNLQVKSPPASIHVPVEKRTMQNVNIPPFKVPPGHLGTPPGHISIPVKEPPYGKIGKADCKPPPSAPLDQGYMQITPGGSNSMPPLGLSKGGLTSKGIPPPPPKQHSAESAPHGPFRPFDVEAWMHLVSDGRPPTREERDELRAAGHVIPEPPTESVPKPKPKRRWNRSPPLTEPVNDEMPGPVQPLSTGCDRGLGGEPSRSIAVAQTKMPWEQSWPGWRNSVAELRPQKRGGGRQDHAA